MVQPYQYQTNDGEQPRGQLVRNTELAGLAGVSNRTVRRLCQNGMLPAAVANDKDGYALFDLADPTIIAWLESLGRKPTLDSARFEGHS